jgi:hypothetical protein
MDSTNNDSTNNDISFPFPLDIPNYQQQDQQPQQYKSFLESSKREARGLNQGDVEPRIVGGTLVVEGEYPFYAFPAGFLLCGSTLIHEDILLTAAHCEGAFLDGIIIGGVTIDGSGSTFIGVDLEFQHPDYTPGAIILELRAIILELRAIIPEQI